MGATLVFNGSPHREGDTAALADRLAQGLEGKIDTLWAYTAGISPCIDCRFCFTHRGCALHDGMDEVYRLIEAADRIVIASPVYFSELTGPLLSLLSRLQTYWCAKTLRGEKPFARAKKGGVLLAGGGDGSAARALETATVLLRHMGAEIAGYACSLQTNTLPARLDDAALAQTDRLARALMGERAQEPPG